MLGERVREADFSIGRRNGGSTEVVVSGKAVPARGRSGRAYSIADQISLSVFSLMVTRLAIPRAGTVTMGAGGSILRPARTSTATAPGVRAKETSVPVTSRSEQLASAHSTVPPLSHRLAAQALARHGDKGRPIPEA